MQSLLCAESQFKPIILNEINDASLLFTNYNSKSFLTWLY